MRTSRFNTSIWVSALLVAVLFGGSRSSRACPDRDEFINRFGCLDGDDTASTPKKKKAKKKKSKASLDKKTGPKIRWGQHRTESDAEYDKRFSRVLKRIKQDKKDDFSGGKITDGKENIRLWTSMGHPFIVRTDISAEFTADTVMYMEMLHRDYGAAYNKFLGVPASVKESIEVIVFADRATYMRNGGSPGSGGQFMPAVHFLEDRGNSWPARHFRLMQFTDGIRDFGKWEKGTLKHEAAHMELQLRLGMTLFYNVVGYPVRAPNWWNEGHASVFEFWDFDKDVDENLREVSDRGRYAPFIRRLLGTDKWKNFDYVWKIDPASWHRDMTTEQGYLNYCQSWSLAAYMMTSGREGRSHFRGIFDLSRRVGVNRQTTYQGDTMLAWLDKFPIEEQERLEKDWLKWVKANVTRDERVPDEEFYVRAFGYDAKIVDRLEHFSEEDAAANAKWIKKELKRRRSSKIIEK